MEPYGQSRQPPCDRARPDSLIMFLPSTVRATFPENWPDALKDLSVPAAEIEVDVNDVQMLGTFNGFVRQNTETPQVHGFSKEFYQKIEAGLTDFPTGVMPRLGYCSWKGSTIVHKPAKTLADVMQTVTQNDPRIGRALTCAIVAEESVTLHLRQWQTIPPSSEFRVFVKDGAVLGVSQYHWRESFSELLRNASGYADLLQTLLLQVLPVLHLDECVIDICAHPEAAFVIEINPLIKQTDFCLFGRNGGDDFDGSMRLFDGRDVVSVRPYS